MNKKFLIIADDFTGSNDTGVQLEKSGVDTSVILFPKAEKIEQSVVLDTESRNLTREHSYAKVKKLTSTILEKNQFKLVYKKIDSTLRGNIAVEVKAIMEVFQPDLVVIAPAFPKIHRTTKNSIHYLNGRPLMETELTQDPLSPITTDNIQQLFQQEFDAPIATYQTEELEKASHFKAATFHIFDVSTDEHLKRIKQLAAQETGKILYVGSAGLAEYLFQPDRLPALSVIGSISQASLDQMLFAERQGVKVITIEINDLIKAERIKKYESLVRENLAHAADTIMTVTRKKEDYLATIELFESLGIGDKAEVSRIIRETLAQITKKVLETSKISKLFLTGGDTAIEVMNALGARGCKIKSELFTGIVDSSLVGGDYDGLEIISKAGAFGEKDALYRCLKEEGEKIE